MDFDFGSNDQKTKDDGELIVTSQSESPSDVDDFSKYVDRMESSKTKRLKVGQFTRCRN